MPTNVRVARRIVETRLLDAIVHGLFDADEVARFQDALRQRLAAADDLDAQRRELISELRRSDRQARNLIEALKQGVAIQMIRDEARALRMAAGRDQAPAGGPGPGRSSRRDDPGPARRLRRGAGRPARLVEQDPVAAREQIRALVGEIRLLPYEGHLIAYLTGDLFGLLGLTAEVSDLLLWREPAGDMMAGVGCFVDDDLTGFQVMRVGEDGGRSAQPCPGRQNAAARRVAGRRRWRKSK